MGDTSTTGIRPHIRVNGGWSIWEAKEAGLETNISLDKWYRARISCDNGEIFIKLYCDDELIFDRNWKIPIGNVVFKFKYNEKESEVPFSINLEYGSAGFRNSGDEKAFIRNVLIQKL